MYNYILLIMLSLSVNSNNICVPYLRIQPAGSQDKYIPDIILYNSESSINDNYSGLLGISNEISSNIDKTESIIFILEKNYTTSFIEKFAKRIVSQKVAEQKNMFKFGTNKISYCIKSNNIETGYFDDKQKLYFLKELKKIIHNRYKNDKSKLFKYDDMLNTEISGLEYSIKHR